MTKTYKITTTYLSTGQVQQVDYQPKQIDENVPGCVTSMRQYRSYLRGNLNAEKPQLYIIDRKGRSQTLVDDEDLLSAVRDLPNRGALAVTAIGVLRTMDEQPSNGIGTPRNLTRIRSGEIEARGELPKVVTSESELRKILERFCRYSDLEFSIALLVLHGAAPDSNTPITMGTVFAPSATARLTKTNAQIGFSQAKSGQLTSRRLNLNSKSLYPSPMKYATYNTFSPELDS